MSNEVLWEGGPTQTWIDEQKKLHGDVFKAVVGGKTYVYRTLKRPEYREIQKTMITQMTPNGLAVNPEQGLEMEDTIVKKCVIWPTDFSIATASAGSPSLLSAYISEASGFAQPAEPEQL